MCFLAYANTNTSCFPKPLTTFLTCFRGEGRNYARKKFPQPDIELKTPGQESDTLTIVPPGQASQERKLAATRYEASELKRCL